MDKVVLYARVSNNDLFNANQKQVLMEWAERNGVKDPIYLEEQVSSRKTRPIKESIIQMFRKGEVKTIVVVRIDRFARSLQELVMDIEGIINDGGRFVSIMNGFDFDRKNYNASQQLILSIFSSFAQFEREIIRERTLEGLARARAWGKIGGRHPKNCGCGKRLLDGGKHDGWMKPRRDASNRIIGWFDERQENVSKQTPPETTVSQCEDVTVPS